MVRYSEPNSTSAPLESSMPRPTVKNRRLVKLLVPSDGVISVCWISAPRQNIRIATSGTQA